MLGAAAGYGVGSLGEQLLPERWQKGKLKRTLAGLGGFVSASPGLLNMAVNHSQGKSLLNSDLWDTSTPPDQSPSVGYPTYEETTKTSCDTRRDAGIQPLETRSRVNSPNVGRIEDVLDPQLKQAISDTGYELTNPLLPVDSFRKMRGQRRVSDRTRLATRLQGAAQLDRLLLNLKARGIFTNSKAAGRRYGAADLHDSGVSSNYEDSAQTVISLNSGLHEDGAQPHLEHWTAYA